ncbi:MAG: UbiA family prenyltransferase [Hydrogenibacillus sp.]|nr:UbiA family prenyltransferase [Hydrogenibacillus sp.]
MGSRRYPPRGGALAARRLQPAVLFSVISSAVYVWNDYMDLEADRRHPVKRHRPMASGRLHPTRTLALAILWAIGALAFAVRYNRLMFLVLLVYLVLNALYSWRFKHGCRKKSPWAKRSPSRQAVRSAAEMTGTRRTAPYPARSAQGRRNAECSPTIRRICSSSSRGTGSHAFCRSPAPLDGAPLCGDGRLDFGLFRMLKWKREMRTTRGESHDLRIAVLRFASPLGAVDRSELDRGAVSPAGRSAPSGTDECVCPLGPPHPRGPGRPDGCPVDRGAVSRADRLAGSAPVHRQAALCASPDADDRHRDRRDPRGMGIGPRQGRRPAERPHEASRRQCSVFRVGGDGDRRACEPGAARRTASAPGARPTGPIEEHPHTPIGRRSDHPRGVRLRPRRRPSPAGGRLTVRCRSR